MPVLKLWNSVYLFNRIYRGQIRTQWKIDISILNRLNKQILVSEEVWLFLSNLCNKFFFAIWVYKYLFKILIYLIRFYLQFNGSRIFINASSGKIQLRWCVLIVINCLNFAFLLQICTNCIVLYFTESASVSPCESGRYRFWIGKFVLRGGKRNVTHFQGTAVD